MLNRKIRPSIALPILIAITVTAFATVNRAASAATETPKTVWGDQQCLSCHNDLATLKKMQDKKGDSTFCQAAYDAIQHEKKNGQAVVSTKKPNSKSY